MPPAKPVARFSAPTSIGSNIPLQVINQSTAATAFLWTWGDGTTSTAEAPAHLYDWFGKVRIRLAVTSAGGTDTTSQMVQVNPGGPPAAVLSTLMGRYGGRLYTTLYAGSSSTTTYRDTVLALTSSNPSQVRIYNTDFGYQVGSYTRPLEWYGHAPKARRNVLFTSFRNLVQLETPGDSIYLYTYFGGVVQASAIRKFYGKRLP